MCDVEIIPRSQTVCFTGHRPNKLAGYNKDGYVVLVNYICDLAERLYIQFNIRRFITGGAQGFDQCAFWGVYKCKLKHSDWNIQLEVFVPYHGQAFKWSKVGLFGRNDYKLMLKFADRVFYAHDKYIDTYWESLQRLDNRNHAMVDESSFVIALYNPGFEDKGGTLNCINYARKQHVPIMY